MTTETSLSSSLEEELAAINEQLAQLRARKSALLSELQAKKLDQASSLANKKIVVIGGRGGLGSFFTKIFAGIAPSKMQEGGEYQVSSDGTDGSHNSNRADSSNNSSYNSDSSHKSAVIVEVLDKDNADQAPQILEQAQLVIFAVPIHDTVELIKYYAPFIPAEAGICDLTSIKEPIVKAMLEAHPGPVLGMHPMFGPDTRSLEKQLVITCPGRDKEYFQPYLAFFASMGARLAEVSASRHDQMMTQIQAVRHFNTFLQGLFLAKEGYSVEELMAVSSPIYSLELTMIGRLFAQNASLYADIIYDNQHIKATLSRYAQIFEQAKDALDRGDKDFFFQGFQEGKDFFADYAYEYLSKSALILQQTTTFRN